MATLNFTGAESGSSNGDAGVLIGGTSSVQGTTKRTGGYAFQTNPTTTAVGWVGVTNPLGASLGASTVYIRAYFRYATKPASGSEIIYSVHTNVTDPSPQFRCGLFLGSDGKLSIQDPNNSVLATGATVLSSDTWYRLELKVIQGTSGSFDVLINGVSEISGSINTDVFTSSALASVYFGKSRNTSGNTVDFFIDDILINDSGFPGAGEIQVMQADGNGTYTAWTGVYTDVDELPHDSDTTYVNTSTINNVESVTLESAASAGISGTINSVKSNAVVRRSGTSTNIRVRLRSGTTDNDTADYALLTTYAGAGKVYDTDINGGGAWTTGGLDGLEVGVLHNQSQSREARCTAMYVMVDYTPAGGPPPAGPGVNSLMLMGAGR